MYLSDLEIIWLVPSLIADEFPLPLRAVYRSNLRNTAAGYMQSQALFSLEVEERQRVLFVLANQYQIHTSSLE